MRACERQGRVAATATRVVVNFMMAVMGLWVGGCLVGVQRVFVEANGDRRTAGVCRAEGMDDGLLNKDGTQTLCILSVDGHRATLTGMNREALNSVPADFLKWTTRLKATGQCSQHAPALVAKHTILI